MKYIFIYLAVISFVSSITAISDKISAKRGGNRVRESVLLFLGALGGAWAMYVTMRLINHKTRKPKFMILLPLFFVIHIIILFAVSFYYFM